MKQGTKRTIQTILFRTVYKRKTHQRRVEKENAVRSVLSQ